MADYHPLISRAVAGLDKNNGEARRTLYDRARAALLAQLRSVTPALSESDITRERLALEESIRKVEAEAARQFVEPSRQPPTARSRPSDPLQPEFAIARSCPTSAPTGGRPLGAAAAPVRQSSPDTPRKGGRTRPGAAAASSPLPDARRSNSVFDQPAVGTGAAASSVSPDATTPAAPSRRRPPLAVRFRAKGFSQLVSDEAAPRPRGSGRPLTPLAR